MLPCVLRVLLSECLHVALSSPEPLGLAHLRPCHRRLSYQSSRSSDSLLPNPLRSQLDFTIHPKMGSRSLTCWTSGSEGPATTIPHGLSSLARCVSSRPYTPTLLGAPANLLSLPETLSLPLTPHPNLSSSDCVALTEEPKYTQQTDRSEKRGLKSPEK